jgi:hypothetical protein
MRSSLEYFWMLLRRKLSIRKIKKIMEDNGQ